MLRVEDYISNGLQSHVIELVEDNMTEKDDSLLELILDVGYRQGRNELIKQLLPKFRPVRAVYSSDKNIRRMKIRELVSEDVVISERISSNEIRVETLTDVYIGLAPSDYTRGYKNHYVYIDERLKESHTEIVQNIIIPSTVVARQVYPEGFKYNWYDHIIYFTPSSM